MTPKELLDTVLGYLGFVTEIDEQRGEGGNLTLQIYTEEANRIIGRDGETLEAIQFLINRLIQSKDREAEKVIVDCEHYRSMREDKIVAPHRAQRFQGRSRRRDLEPERFRADQADYLAETAAEKRASGAGKRGQLAPEFQHDFAAAFVLRSMRDGGLQFA
jgi:spoIIIJ-associated protein